MSEYLKDSKIIEKIKKKKEMKQDKTCYSPPLENFQTNKNPNKNFEKFIDFSKGPFISFNNKANFFTNFSENKNVKNNENSLSIKNSLNQKNDENYEITFKNKILMFEENFNQFNENFIEELRKILDYFNKNYLKISNNNIFEYLMKNLKLKLGNFNENFQKSEEKLKKLEKEKKEISNENVVLEIKIEKLSLENKKLMDIISLSSTTNTEKYQKKENNIFHKREIENFKNQLADNQNIIAQLKEKEKKLISLLIAVKKRGIDLEKILNEEVIKEKTNTYNDEDSNESISNKLQLKKNNLQLIGNSFILADHSSFIF